MSAPPDGVAGVFDRAAATYDAVGVPFFRPIADALVAELAPRPGARALDVGCGRGAVLAPLAAAVGPTGAVLGVDLAPRMVELTAADLAHLPQVAVRVADAADPGTPPQAFDIVTSSLVLFFLPDPVPALRRWRESLVPGGRLGVTTFGAQDERWRAVDDLFAPHLPPRMADARTTGRAGPYASDAGVEALLAAAGLFDVRTVHQVVRLRFRDAAHWRQFSWSHGQRAMWEAVPEVERDELAARAAAVMEPLRDAAGAITFTQDVRHTLGRR